MLLVHLEMSQFANCITIKTIVNVCANSVDMIIW